MLRTTNNYNTQTTECLHIDLAKDTYVAFNQKDKLPQMTTWLEQKEKVFALYSSIQQSLIAQSQHTQTDTQA